MGRPAQKKYVDAVKTYSVAVTGYMYIAEVTQKPMDPGADAVMHEG